MGMDYVWSGSASYPRFTAELIEVAEIFGGQCDRLQYFPNPINQVEYIFEDENDD